MTPPRNHAGLRSATGALWDGNVLEARLINVGYSRLSVYLHPFRRRNADGRIEDDFVSGTMLDKVWAHYLFDRHLRFMLMDAIERIEVALRSRIAFFHTEKRSPFAPSTGNLQYPPNSPACLVEARRA